MYYFNLQQEWKEFYPMVYSDIVIYHSRINVVSRYVLLMIKDQIDD